MAEAYETAPSLPAGGRRAAVGRSAGGRSTGGGQTGALR